MVGMSVYLDFLPTVEISSPAIAPPLLAIEISLKSCRLHMFQIYVSGAGQNMLNMLPHCWQAKELTAISCWERDSYIHVVGVGGKGAGQTTTNYNYDDTNWLCFCMCVCVCCSVFALRWSWFYLFIYIFFIFFFLFGVSNNPKCQDTQTGDTWHVRLVIVSLAFGWLSIHLNIFPTHPKADKNKIVKNHKA